MVTADASTHNNTRKIVNEADQDTGLFIWTTENLEEATQTLKGQWVVGDNSNSLAESAESLQATRIITDTRKLEPGDIYLAIIGENFDGHKFLNAAEEKGAIAAIVSQTSTQVSMPQLQVADTRLAFGQLAAYRRKQHQNLKVIAITGSSGKTTVKEMLRSIFLQAETAINTTKKASVDQIVSNSVAQSEPSLHGLQNLQDSPNLQSQSSTASPSSQSPSEPNQLASTLVTRGNLNNDFGVPMMLLELSNKHQYAVLELGANHVGEIVYTANMVQPDVACILNIGTAHLGEFGGRDNIAKTKAEIYLPLTRSSIAVVPVDDDYAEFLADKAKQNTDHVIRFGWQQVDSGDSKSYLDQNDTLKSSPHAQTVTPSSSNSSSNDSLPDVYATEVLSTALQSSFTLCFNLENSQFAKTSLRDSEIDLKQDLTLGANQDLTLNSNKLIKLPIVLPMAGKHNVTNALAAAACAFAVGIEPDVIALGLSHTKSKKGRLGRQSLGNHQIIDDTYNANPNSVQAAADVLAAQEGMKILVLGDIGELGDASIVEHIKVGQGVAVKNIDMLLCVGEYAKHTVSGAAGEGMQNAYAFDTKPELLAKLIAVLDDKNEQTHNCTLLFKGSRSASMETLIESLTSHFE